MVFKYLDLKNLKTTEIYDDIFFMENEEDKYGVLRYGTNDKRLFISGELYGEISSMFDLSEYDTKQIISSWVESFLEMKVNTSEVWPTKFMFFINRLPIG